MQLDEFKDLIKLNDLAKSWLEDYTQNNLGAQSDKFKKQAKEMKIVVAKTSRIMEQQSGDFAASKDWKTLYSEIEELAKSSSSFAACFGKVKESTTNTLVAPETALLAIRLKKMATAWIGQFGDDNPDEKAKSLIFAVYELSKKIATSPKSMASDAIVLNFYASTSKQSRKMLRTVEFVQGQYEGLIEVVVHKIEDKTESLKKLGIKNLPAMIFKKGKEKIAAHEGVLSISATEQKVAVLIEGGKLTDSTSVPSIKNLKLVNKKELYAMGEYLLFYFEAPWCGICKKTTDVVEQYANSYSKVKFESVQIDGGHSLHTSFGVTEVPSLVFVRKGKVIGKHIGYINPSNFQKLLEDFAVANKRSLGLIRSGESTIITEAEDKDKAKTKTKS